MKKNILHTLAITVPCMALLLSACGSDSQPRMGKGDVQAKTSVKAETHLLSSDDFDLEMVVGIVKGNGLKDIQSLEDQINSKETGINNVDIDADGTIDYILIKESKEGKAFTLEFLAVPSKSGKEEDATLIGSMNIKQTAQGTDVSGGYPEYVSGHDSHYYNYHRPGLSFGQAMFLSYMFMPGRMMFVHPMGYYGGMGYMGRGYMSPGVRSSTRSTYTTTHQNTVKKTKSSAKPKNYKSAPSAKAGQKKFDTGKVKANPKDKSLTSRNNQSKAYNKRNANQSKKKASGFGSKKSSGSSKSSNRGSSRSSGGSSSRSSGGSFGLPASTREIVRV